jgi:ubiquinone/menaquinone biosynthesis C-methylase UbiE
MTTSRSFDRAADIYDETRPLLEPIAKQGIQAILDIVAAKRRLLEVGAGTGRISIPLLQRGLDLVGCDISSKMLRRLHEKFPPARIAQADAALLPFPNAHFDSVLTVHVLHLIPSWREALHEFRRVLVPNGLYLNVRTWVPSEGTIRQRFRAQWQGWLEAQGINTHPVGVRDQSEFAQEMQSLGAQLTQIEVVRYPLTFTLSEEMERLASRIDSLTWDIPDAIFEASIKELRAWVAQEYDDLDQPREDEARMVIDVARFEG